MMVRQRSVWLAVSALALGAGALLAAGSVTAHADAGASASDGARSAGAAARSSARESGQRRSAAFVGNAATPARNADAARSTVMATQRTSGVGAAPTSAPCLQSQTCGTVTFGFTGALQSWTVPAGVQSVLVTMQGGYGGGDLSFDLDNIGRPAYLQANLQLTGGSLPAPTTSLSVYVPSGGGFSGGNNPGGDAGNGTGGAGGSGSVNGDGGGGGGGAAVVATVAGDPSTGAVVLVAGGGGGAGGDRNGSGGAGGAAGGAQTAGASPTPEGVWPGNDGSAGTSDDNPGGGGAGGTQSSGIGTDGGDAETLSGNGGGGGGGGGWLGGSGGAPGQASASPFSTSGAGGGGGGGSSYADPDYTTLAVAGPPRTLVSSSVLDGIVILNWVDILTQALRPLRSDRTTDQQLVAASFLPTNPATKPTLTWSASAGLPEGLTLSPSGALSGKPKKAGPYSFVATVQGVTAPGFLVYGGQMDITSVITYSGSVCTPRCGRGGRT